VLAVLEALEERRKAHEASVAKVPELKKKRSLFVNLDKDKETATEVGAAAATIEVHDPTKREKVNTHIYNI
jgi:hypothetical protein